MKRSIGIIISVLWLASVGCVDDPRTGDETHTSRVSPDGNVAPVAPEMVVFESHMASKFGLPDLMDPHGFTTGIIDPCECVTPACLDSWAQQELGCNICVSLYCDGLPGPHVCSDCDEQ